MPELLYPVALQDLRHLKSVPELARASPEAARPDAPLSVSPITVSPIPGPRSQSLPKRSPAADVTPLPSRQASSRYTGVFAAVVYLMYNGPCKHVSKPSRCLLLSVLCQEAVEHVTGVIS